MVRPQNGTAVLKGLSWEVKVMIVFFFHNSAGLTEYYYGGPQYIGPTVHSKSYIFYRFLLTTFGPICYGPP